MYLDFRRQWLPSHECHNLTDFHWKTDVVHVRSSRDGCFQLALVKADPVTSRCGIGCCHFFVKIEQVRSISNRDHVARLHLNRRLVDGFAVQLEVAVNDALTT